MSLSTPTTAEISENIIAQLQVTLNQTIPLLPRAFNRVIAKVLGAVFILLYKYVGVMFLNIFVSKASFKETEINGVMLSPLIEWGKLLGEGTPGLATQAELLIDITVENQTGSLPSGTQLLNSGNGVTYITIGAILLDASTVNGTIRAVSDQSGGLGAGVIGNLDPGAVVSFANPLANVARDAVVDSQVVTGADAEDPEVYRTRVVNRFSVRPQGGAYADYRIWGEEVPGILNIYPYTGVNPGEVDVFAEATVASSGSADGIPTSAQLTAVFDSIELDLNGIASRRQTNAFVNVDPITRTGYEVTVTGLAVDNPGAVQTDITAALVEYFLEREPFVPGLTRLPRKDTLTRSAIIGLVSSIVEANSGVFTTGIFIPTGIGGSIEQVILDPEEKTKNTGVNYIA